MQNPFVYGKEVSKENFCNRISEIKELLRDIGNSQNVMIFSQRRFGKTSLIKRVFEDLDLSQIIPIYVDLYPVLSEEDFIRIYAKALSRTVTKDLADKIKDLSSVFKRIRPTYSVDQTGQVSFSIDIKNEDIIPAIEDVLEGLNRYTKKEKKKAVVCFDEFQQISQLKTDKLEKFMRSVFQSHKNISYIFMGSKKHLIYDMFNNPGRPFYRSAKPFPLHKIEDKKLSDFIIDRFKMSRKTISPALTDQIIITCESHPYYVQYLCHILWEKAIDKKTITSKDLTGCLNTLLLRESSAFEATWDLLTVKQKQVLIALALTAKDDKMFSAFYLRKHKLGSASSVQRTVESLIEKDLIDKNGGYHSIIDIIFKKWIVAHNA